MDEPTSGLDPMERIRFRNLIGQLADDRIVLLSTHIVSDIEAIAKEVFVMRQGKIIEQGTVRELCRDIPCHVWIYRDRAEEVRRYVAESCDPSAIIKNDGAYTEICVLSEHRPKETARCVEATLEDVFLYHFGETGGE